MNCNHDLPAPRRRDALKLLSCGFGFLALRSLIAQSAMAQQPPEAGPLDPKAPHFAPRAKRVIFLCMDGAPSHVDTFDYKPELAAHDGQAVSGKYRAGAQADGLALEVRAARPERPVDLRALPRARRSTPTSCASCTACRPTCPPTRRRSLQMHTGSFQFARPSLGAWTLYGLGTAEREPARLRHDQPARSTAARRTTAAPSCPRSTRARRSARPAAPAAASAPRTTRRCPTSPTSGSRRPRSASSSTSCRRSTASTCGASTTAPRSRA